MAEKAYFVHPSSYVDEGCDIGAGTKIWHFSHIMSGCTIGERCNIGQNVVISPGVRLGTAARSRTMSPSIPVWSVRTACSLAPPVFFTNVINPRAFIERKSEYRRTVVKKGASIGANATIVCGHDIGRYAFVGAGSVVTKNVPDYAMVYGSPAKVQGYVCQCGEKLHFAEGKACCTACGKQYHMNDKSAVEELEKI